MYVHPFPVSALDIQAEFYRQVASQINDFLIAQGSNRLLFLICRNND